MTSPTTTPLTPARLWKRMTSEQRKGAALAFWQDDQGANEQMQAVFLISQQKKARPKFVIGLDDERKAGYLASIVNLPDALAGRALIAYHLADQRPMMGAFLDALGIAHENGLINEENVTPDPEKVAPAAAAIGAQYPPDQVSLYLNTLFCQDPETWRGLAEVPERKD
jgi:hypothetical protein